MIRTIIEYFAKRHLLANFIAAGVIITAIFAWQETGKESMPDVTFDIVRINTSYKNASPADVEYFITKPIEDSLNGINGISTVSSTSGSSSSSITVELEDNPSERDNIINEIRSSVLEIDFPDDAGTPRLREIKTSERSVLDIALIDLDQKILTAEGRKRLQDYAETLKKRIERLSTVREVSVSGALDNEIVIRLDPDKLAYYNMAVTDVIDILSANSFRLPAGVIKDKDEIKVSIVSELDTPDKIRKLIVRGTFDGATVRISDLGTVDETFEEYVTITKYNSHEGVRLNIVKKSSAGIIEANDMIMAEVDRFKNNVLKEAGIDTVLMDDESTAVRERLALISVNGLIGFVFVILTLFIFLDFTSGFWVAAGIPFSMCFTIIFVYLSGYTINNMTMAAVILVMGMVVDDAIIVAENVGRLRHNGTERKTAVIEGTVYVLKPVIASIITTCVAFTPLYFFGGRFGKFVSFIPLLIFLMLCGSLLEALLILPSHLSIALPDFLKRKNKKLNGKGHWFEIVEDKYGKILEKLLGIKTILYILLIALLYTAFSIVSNKMSFVLFPREEVTRVDFEGAAPKGTDKFRTAELAQQVEEIFQPYIGREVIAVRTDIARSRRGAAVEENRFTIEVQLVSRDNREKSSSQLTKEWEGKFPSVQGLESLKIRRGWFGQSSGSPIEILVQENNDTIRNALAQELSEELKKIPGVSSSEVQEQKRFSEYVIDYRKEVMQRLNISVSAVTRTIKAILNRYEVYTIDRDDETELPVQVTVPDNRKKTIEQVFSVPVKNSGGYLVPLKTVLEYKKIDSPETIFREDFARTIRVYADIREGSKMTPAGAGVIIENTIFPELYAKYPSSKLKFGGEIRDTRESGNDIFYSTIAVIIIIYVVLSLLFNSMVKPLIIMLSIPFGAAGVVFALYFHGITIYGFFSAIGLIGLSGVVVNDAIVMLDKLEKEYSRTEGPSVKAKVASIAKTRLRAVFLTTITTVAGLIPTAYGFAGYDSMLSDMMLVMAWGLIFGTIITLLLIPMLYCSLMSMKYFRRKDEAGI
ncbi:MAG: efflux RND transporter permease subunit [Spirochaetales bacterium]|nr:efflux RND transporter permease subunit [Spirochaetales bacterium]